MESLIKRQEELVQQVQTSKDKDDVELAIYELDQLQDEINGLQYDLENNPEMWIDLTIEEFKKYFTDFIKKQILPSTKYLQMKDPTTIYVGWNLDEDSSTYLVLLYEEMIELGNVDYKKLQDEYKAFLYEKNQTEAYGDSDEYVFDKLYERERLGL